MTISRRYELLDQLGEGGTSVVHRARDHQRGGLTVAVKVLKDSVDPSLLAAEFRALSELRHPHLVRVLDLDSGAAGACLSSEFVDGEELFSATRGRPLEELMSVALDILDALSYIHGRGLLHLDIKPANLMARESDEGLLVKLADFGFATRQGGLSSRGTPGYAAPELIRGEIADSRTDLYAFGVTLFEVLSGETPFSAEDSGAIARRQLEAEAPRLDGLLPELPGTIVELVAGLLSREREQRPASAQAVSEIIKTAGFQRRVRKRRSVQLGDAAFVGRERELEWLEDLFSETCQREGTAPGRWSSRRSPALAARLGGRALSGDRRRRRRAEAGPPTTLALLGELGSGRRRLALELRPRVQLAGGVFLECQGRRDLGAPLSAVQNLSLALSDLPSFRKPQFRSHAQALAAYIAESEKAEEARGHKLQEGLIDAIIALSCERPVVLLCPNLDRAAPELLRFVLALHRALAVARRRPRDDGRRPSALLLLTRSARHSLALDELSRDSSYESLELAPLSTDDLAGLLRSLYGQVAVPRGLAQSFAAASRGNPFRCGFLAETLDAAGLLEPKDGKLCFVRGRGRPAALEARLPRNCIANLPQAARRVMRLLAALDRPASAALIAEAVRVEVGAVEATMEALSRPSLLRRIDSAEDATYCLAHEVIGDSLQLSPEQRSEDAAALAKALVGRGGAEPEAVWQALVAGAEGCLEEARELAADCALRGLHERALELYRRALVLLDRDPEEPWALSASPSLERLRLDLLSGLARSFIELERFDEARSAVFNELALARRLDDRHAELAALTRMGRVNTRLREFEDARRCFFESLKTARGIESTQGIGLSLSALGDLTLARGRIDEALAYFEQSLELAQSLGQSREAAGYLRAISRASMRQGDVDAALGRCREALELELERDDPVALAETRQLLADLHSARREPEEAVQLLTQVIDLYRGQGASVELGSSLVSQGCAYAALNRPEQAVERFEEATRLARRGDHRALLARSLNELGWLRLRALDSRSALAHFNEATTLWNTLGDQPRYALGLSNLGLAQDRLGDTAKALDCYDAALRVARALADEASGAEDGAVSKAAVRAAGLREIEAGWGKAEALAGLGRLGEARELYERAALDAETWGDQRLQALALSGLAPLLASLGEMRASARIAARLDELSGLDQETLARVRLAIARAALGRDDLASALACLRERDQWIVGAGGMLALEADLAAGQALSRLGDGAGAEALLDEILERARSAGLAALECRTLLAIGHSLLVEAKLRGQYRIGKSVPTTEESLGRAEVYLEHALVKAESLERRDDALAARVALAELCLVSGSAEEAAEAAADIEEASQELPRRALAARLVALEAAAFLDRKPPCPAPEPSSADEFSAFETARLRLVEALTQRRSGARSQARAILLELRESFSAIALRLKPTELERFRRHPLGRQVERQLDELAKDERELGSLHEVEAAEKVRDRLLSLITAARQINSAGALDDQLEAILESAVQTFGAERGFLVEVSAHEPRIAISRAADGAELPPKERRISTSLVKRVAISGEPLVTVDALGDRAWSGKRSVTKLGLRSVLCVPLAVAGVVSHVLVLDHRSAGRFESGDLPLTQTFADLAAVALQKTRLGEIARRRATELETRAAEIERLNQALSKQVATKDHELEEIRSTLEGHERELRLKYDYRNIVGQSTSMLRVFQLLDKVTDSDVPVFVHGESGTGKELVAKAIHWNGPRKGQAILSVNCAAISDSLLESELFGHTRGAFTGATANKEGLFKAADRGTIFLDEVGDMSPAMQTRLLRVLQEGEVRPVGARFPIKVDVRVVSASNKDLRKLVEAGSFRADLFYRLNVVEVQLPPLRERREDIALLVEHFLGSIAEASGATRKPIERGVVERLVAWDWPGNVRELENELRRLVAISGTRIIQGDLQPEMALAVSLAAPAVTAPEAPNHEDSPSLKLYMEKVERAYLIEALAQNEGNKTRTAKSVGLSRFGFLKKLDKYGLREKS